MKKEVQTEETKKYPHEAFEKIEESRVAFLAKYRKHDRIKLAVVVVCFIAIFAAFIFIPTYLGPVRPKLSDLLTIVICVFFLGGGLAYAILIRKYLDKKMHVYFENYFKRCNDFVFDSKEYSDVELQTPGKIDVDRFNECLLYKDVISVGSRALTKFKFHKVEMEVVETAGNIKNEKNRLIPTFVGKEVFGKAKYEGKDPVFIYLKGNERAIPPTNLGGITKVEDNAQLMICTNAKDYKKVLTKEVMTLVKAIKTDKNLVDLAISIHSGKVYVLMGYDDPLMILPLQNEFNSKPTELYKKDLLKVCALVEELGK